MYYLEYLQAGACTVFFNLTDNPFGPVWREEIRRARLIREARGRGNAPDNQRGVKLFWFNQEKIHVYRIINCVHPVI